jgi:four helix bundle protein
MSSQVSVVRYQGKIKSFEDLEVWQKSHALVLAIYKVSATFPKEERFGLTSQLRRAAVSVPANIAEGFTRRGLKDKVHFYNIAQASLHETKYYLILARDLSFMSSYPVLWSQADEIGKMLHGLIFSLTTET